MHALRQIWDQRFAFLTLAALLLLAGVADVGRARAEGPAADNPDERIKRFLVAKTAQLETNFLAGISTAEAFEKARPRMREQLLQMLGLWPLPERTPLHATVTGKLTFKNYTVEKLHFQCLPGVYVTANLYLPRPARRKSPAILYQIGHLEAGRDGHKVKVQDHGIWFASHGYVALLFDTVLASEIPGHHRGTREGKLWWHSLGYTSAGTETWMAMRALDYLASRREVDPARIGATGISGGGGATVWIAAADDRIAAAAPVSGMGDLQWYVAEKGIDRHCDCMLMYNTHQWSWATIAALTAPRPLLFVNSDDDRWFPMSANERIINRLEHVYSLFGASDRVDAMVSMGEHAYRTDLRRAIFEFFNRSLKGDVRPVTDPDMGLGPGGTMLIPPEKLRVFPDDSTLPVDHRNAQAEDAFFTPAIIEPPEPAAFRPWQESLLDRLRATSFANWPASAPEVQARSLGVKPEGGVDTTEPGIAVDWRWIPGTSQAARWLIVLDEQEPPGSMPAWVRPLTGNDAGILLLKPRGGWSPGEKGMPTVERSLALLGTTADAGRIWDVLTFARRRTSMGPWSVAGKGNAGIIAAYAALYEPRLTHVVAIDPPASHRPRPMKDKRPADPRFGPPLLNVMRVLDIPEALGLLAPRPLQILGMMRREKAFDRTEAIYRAAGAAERFTRR